MQNPRQEERDSMSKRRKKNHEEDHMGEDWLLPYADILTLLLALFIVLFASSSVDAKKFEQISNSFNSAFDGGTGIMDHPEMVPEMEELAGQDSLELSETSDASASEEEEEAAALADQEELQGIKEKVDQFIQDRGLEEELNTSISENGLMLSIEDNILFNSGEDEVREEAEALSDEISELLVLSPPRNIVISGHTDNVPISNADFETNWDLSVLRAVHFMQLLLNNPDLDPAIFSAKGYGEHNPTASNDTAEGRAQNRRVEILVLPLTEDTAP